MTSRSNTATYLYLSDEDAIWSHSKLECYRNCKYSFYLKYITGLREEPRFFSQYGSFVHKILEKYLKCEIKKEQLSMYYLENFDKEVTAPAPSPKIFLNYFNDGLNYFKNKDNFDFGNVVGVEKSCNFTVLGKKFRGIIDLIIEEPDGSITIVDHKSRNLKPYSNRRKPTKTDMELDKYFKQLYLYSTALECEGINASKLKFNCFREGLIIESKPNPETKSEINKEIISRIDEIVNTEKWTPNGLESEFFCRWLCGFTEQCDYYQSTFGRG